MSKHDMPHESPRGAGLPSRLIDRRKVLGLSQVDVAAELGLSRNAYGEYERGGSKMTLPRVRLLAEILACSPGWLAFGEGPMPTN